jgi:hypothetical protein
MIDETAKQSEKNEEDDEKSPKKRKQEPLMANTKQEVDRLFKERKPTLGKKLHNE